ncbi:hypothetical protein PDIDSM_50 [Penicillium digitatum]|nr:hypothetical protein PDIDSM_50 [Penicillium digitatum]
MVRPRRAAAQKPEGHYAAATSPIKKRRISTIASSARKKGKQKTEFQYAEDAMRLPLPGFAPAPAPAPAPSHKPIPVMVPPPLNPAALALDLKKSYEGQIPLPTLPKRQKRWRQPAKNPIIRLEDTPKGWNAKEPDLDPDDLEAQIARGRERIGDNIMSRVFEFTLEKLLKEQKSREAMMDLEPAGLSWPVVQRLQTLQGTLEWLQSENDKYELVGNVTNIMAAYRSGHLRWNPGLVTYWSKGVLLCQPRPFRWNEFDIINAQHDGHTGFWVEGLEGQSPIPQMAEWIAKPFPGHGEFCTHMDLSLKLPQSTIQPTALFQPVLPSMPLDFSFMDDTGASVMQINESDMRNLVTYNCDPLGNDPPLPPLLGSMAVTLANGSTERYICRRFEVNMWSARSTNYLDFLWHPVQVLIHDDTVVSSKVRLNGPWLRHRMYTASAPDSTSYTYFGDIHPRFMSVPTANPLHTVALLPDLPLDPVPKAAKTVTAVTAVGSARPAAGGLFP